MAHISYSELKEWVSCPWKHKLKYIDGLNPFFGNEHTAFGTAMHTVCENLVKERKVDYKQLFQEEFLKNLKELREVDSKYNFNQELVVDMRTQGENLVDFILPALKKYFGSFELISVEEKLFENMDGVEHNFKGFIDLVVQTKDGTFHIIDWKTCSWGWDARRKNDKITTYQITLYKHFWCKKHNIDPKEVKTHFALLKRTAKKNTVELFKVTSGTKKIENALKLLNKAVYNIKKQSHIKNRLSCYGRYGTCEFYKTEHCK